MLNVFRILVSQRGRRLAIAFASLTALAACGQKGTLFLPTEAAAQGRATLPQALRPAPVTPAAGPAPSPPVTGTASPIPMAP